MNALAHTRTEVSTPPPAPRGAERRGILSGSYPRKGFSLSLNLLRQLKHRDRIGSCFLTLAARENNKI